MRKIVIAALAIAGMLFFAVNAFAASATANATATIQTAIAVANDTSTATLGDLAFGTIVPDAIGGTVTVDPLTGLRLGSGGLALIASTFGPATFDVTGAPDANYAISLPVGPLTIFSGLDSMTVDNWTTDVVGQQVLDGVGAATFNVGGTLTVGANQPSGVYSGTFTVMVDYN